MYCQNALQKDGSIYIHNPTLANTQFLNCFILNLESVCSHH